jgi:hypothetical protein
LIDMSSSLNKLENDLWLRLSDLKCQNNFTQQIRSNQRNHLVSLNEQYQRRVSQIQLKKKNSSTSILFFLSRGN